MKNFFIENFTGQPDGFFVILYTEICELFGRFGITALLVLYLTSDLNFADHSAFSLYGAFIALIFIIPLLGGHYADKFLGYKKAIIMGITLMGIGNLLIAYPHPFSLYLGLAIIAVGSGFFTPSLTALLGKLYHNKENNRDNAFVMYYIAKNLGALLATIFCSLIGQAYGYSYAFLLSSTVMISGLVVFSFGRHQLNHALNSYRPIVKQTQNMALSLMHIGTILALITSVYFMLTHHITNYLFGLSVIVASIVFIKLYYSHDNKTRTHLNAILFALIAMIIFSMFLGQGGTTLNLFIERIVNRQVGSITIPPSMFYALDPLFMLLFGGFVMHFLGKINHANQTITSFYKLIFGLITLAIGFFVFVLASQLALTTSHKPNVLFVFTAYMIFPIAELSIMPITVSLITRLAPKGKDGLMASFYLFGQGVASYLTGVFSKIGKVDFKVTNHASFIDAAKIYHHVFSLSSLLLLTAAVVSILFVFIAKKLKYSKVSPISLSQVQ